MKDKKIIVYTCNVGHYDDYRNLMVGKLPANVRLIYFCDVDKPVAGWDVMPIDKSICSDKTKLARYYKINSTKVLPSHDYSLWIDCRFDFNVDYVRTFVEKYAEHDLAEFDYPRNQSRNVYDEGETIRGGQIDNPSIVTDQMAKYRTEGLPKDLYIGSTGIIVRKNNKLVKEFNDLWWKEVERYSKRDQLSQFYAVWKTGIKCYKIQDGSVYTNELVTTVLKHRHARGNPNSKRNLALINKLNRDPRYKNDRPLKRK
jgi:hypothetical protein